MGGYWYYFPEGYLIGTSLTRFCIQNMIMPILQFQNKSSFRVTENNHCHLCQCKDLKNPKKVQTLPITDIIFQSTHGTISS